jgi:hypothetical protein
VALFLAIDEISRQIRPFTEQLTVEVAAQLRVRPKYFSPNCSSIQ